MNKSIFILLGSNLGDRNSNLSYARQEISRSIGEIVTVSSIYKTAAWGKTEQPAFYNQVIEIKSVLIPEKMLSGILEIEKKVGRARGEKWGPRIIDIDILFYKDDVLSTETLIIPHPRIPDRKFTLLPLSEIAGNLKHPVTGKTVNEMLAMCTDDLLVEKLNSLNQDTPD
jgi:2-amino-4-hydroxy-6-hydroxymethyldihydropteridine diphosphokinase